MIKTFEPFMGQGFVVVSHRAGGNQHFFACAHPAWLRGDLDLDGADARGEWGVGPIGDGLSPLRNSKWCRWWDMLDDATWFVDELDAQALALIVEGYVRPALDMVHPNDNDRWLLEDS